MLSWLLGDGCKDERVRSDSHNQGYKELQGEGDDGVDTLLPVVLVGAVCDALVETLLERTPHDPEHKTLKHQKGDNQNMTIFYVFPTLEML